MIYLTVETVQEAERVHEILKAIANASGSGGIQVTTNGGALQIVNRRRQRAPVAPPSTTTIRRMRIYSINADTLTCVEASGAPTFTLAEQTDILAEGVEVYTVAKPAELRHSVWEGQSYPNDDGILIDYVSTDISDGLTRRLNVQGDPADYEDQVIVPRYEEEQYEAGNWYAGSEILALYKPGQTGVDGVDWIDLNQAGRVWAKDYSEDE